MIKYDKMNNKYIDPTTHYVYYFLMILYLILYINLSRMNSSILKKDTQKKIQ